MNKYILATALSFITVQAVLASNDNDKEKSKTVLTVTTPSSIIITESDDGLSVDIKSNDGNTSETIRLADYDAHKAISTEQSSFGYNEFKVGDGGFGLKNSSKWSCTSSGVLIGLVNPVDAPAGYDIRWSKSFEIGWLNALGVRYSHRSLSVSFGIGFDWCNYKMTTGTKRMVLDSATGVSVAPYPEGATRTSSRIKVFSLGFPLLYTQKIPGSTLALTVGAILNFNTHASLLTRYIDSQGYSMEEYSEGICRRKVSYDLFGSLTFYRGCGLYVRYSPQSVLKCAGAPLFHPLSVGVSLFL